MRAGEKQALKQPGRVGDIDDGHRGEYRAVGTAGIGREIARLPGDVRCPGRQCVAGEARGKAGDSFRLRDADRGEVADEVDEVARLTAERGRKLPLLRDVDVSYDLRQ